MPGPGEVVQANAVGFIDLRVSRKTSVESLCVSAPSWAIVYAERVSCASSSSEEREFVGACFCGGWFLFFLVLMLLGWSVASSCWRTCLIGPFSRNGRWITDYWIALFVSGR